MQALIIAFNQFTYVRNMVSQLEKFPSIEIIIADNNSTYQPMLDWYETCPYRILRFKENHHNTVYRLPEVEAMLDDVFIVTDPDIQLNPNLPATFVEELDDIQRHFKAERVGFALDIQSPDIRTDCRYRGQTIREWESQFWKTRLDYKSYELYYAPVDTTFCLLNRRNRGCIRVAGNFTAKHLPWHVGFADALDKGEIDSYLKNKRTTDWFVLEQG